MAEWLDSPVFVAAPIPRFDEGIAEALRDRGFALVESLDAVTREWSSASERRFALAPATKAALAHGPHDGYVRSGSKEMFHFSRHSDSVAPSVATHVPTAACSHREMMISTGKCVMHSINCHVLNRPMDMDGEKSAIEGWYGHRHSFLSCCDASHSVMVAEHGSTQ
jgi:hypothetical protein